MPARRTMRGPSIAANSAGIDGVPFSQRHACSGVVHLALERERPLVRLPSRERRRQRCDVASGDAYRNAPPGPPHSHFSTPPLRKSTPSAFTSTGITPTE